MDKIKAKYKKNTWYLIINGIKSKSNSIVKSISNYIDTMENPQEMKFVLEILIKLKSGQAVFEMQTCYATSDFTLPFIEELENQINSKNIKLESFKKLDFPVPNIEKDIFLENKLICREYNLKFKENSKIFTLNTLIEHFKKTKVLRKARRIYFNSESCTMSVQNKGVKKPMYRGIMFFSSEESSSCVEDFKKLLQLHDKVLDRVASSVEE